MKELKIFKIEDGETHWLVAGSAEEARRIHIEDFCADEEDVESVEAVSDDCMFNIFITDGYHENERETYPTEPYQDEKGRWFCKATARQWVDISKAGDLIASTMF